MLAIRRIAFLVVFLYLNGITLLVGAQEDKKAQLTYAEVLMQNSGKRIFYSGDRKIAERQWNFNRDGNISTESTKGKIKDGVYFDRANHLSHASYKAGTLHGQEIRCYPNGKLQEERTFIYGRETGVSRFYYDTGAVSRIVVFSSNNRVIFEDYSERGDLLARTVLRYMPLEITESGHKRKIEVITREVF